MAHRYEVTSKDDVVLSVLDLFEAMGHLRQIFDSEIGKSHVAENLPAVTALKTSLPKIVSDPPVLPGLSMYTAAGYTLEKTITNISKDLLGVCEEQKKWDKSLRNAAKEYGHDEILQAFYDWASVQGVFLGRSPVTVFLKNVSTHVRPHTPRVSNPNLDRTEREIAKISDNLVIYTGEYRVRLAALINEFGSELVVEAFNNFLPMVDEKSRPYAARDFLLKAPVMIATIRSKKEEAERQKQAVSAAYTAAQESVDEETEENEL